MLELYFPFSLSLRVALLIACNSQALDTFLLLDLDKNTGIQPPFCTGFLETLA